MSEPQRIIINLPPDYTTPAILGGILVGLLLALAFLWFKGEL